MLTIILLAIAFIGSLYAYIVPSSHDREFHRAGSLRAGSLRDMYRDREDV